MNWEKILSQNPSPPNPQWIDFVKGHIELLLKAHQKNPSFPAFHQIVKTDKPYFLPATKNPNPYHHSSIYVKVTLPPGSLVRILQPELERDNRGSKRIIWKDANSQRTVKLGNYHEVKAQEALQEIMKLTGTEDPKKFIILHLIPQKVPVLVEAKREMGLKEHVIIATTDLAEELINYQREIGANYFPETRFHGVLELLETYLEKDEKEGKSVSFNFHELTPEEGYNIIPLHKRSTILNPEEAIVITTKEVVVNTTGALVVREEYNGQAKYTFYTPYPEMVKQKLNNFPGTSSFLSETEKMGERGQKRGKGQRESI